MKMEEVRRIAKSKGVNPGRMRKADIIHAIQKAEGNFDCFGTPTAEDCDQGACAWREDCLPHPAARQRPI